MAVPALLAPEPKVVHLPMASLVPLVTTAMRTVLFVFTVPAGAVTAQHTPGTAAGSVVRILNERMDECVRAPLPALLQAWCSCPCSG